MFQDRVHVISITRGRDVRKHFYTHARRITATLLASLKGCPAPAYRAARLLQSCGRSRIVTVDGKEIFSEKGDGVSSVGMIFNGEVFM